MPQSSINLAQYFDRIGYQGRQDPTLETLRALQSAHAYSIPFENLDPLGGQVVSLDLASIHDKLVVQRRGGYCFEQNTLLWAVLNQLGFKVTGIAARVRWQVPASVITPLGHMALRVCIGSGQFLVDVGFGGLTLATPIDLSTDRPQLSAHEPCRLSQSHGEYLLEANLGDTWSPLYRFDLAEKYSEDFEVWNWYTCTAPQSPFVKTLMAARLEPRRRHTLRNNRYTLRESGAEETSRLLSSYEDLRNVLEVQLAIPVPASAALESKLREIATSKLV